MMKKIIFVIAFLSTQTWAAAKTGCTSDTHKKLDAAFYSALCEVDSKSETSKSSHLSKIVNLFYSKNRDSQSWSVNSDEWTAFISEHEKAQTLGLTPTHLSDLLQRLESQVTVKEKSSFASFVIRISQCSDGEVSGQLSSSLVRLLQENPTLFLRSLSLEQKTLEAQPNNECAKRTQQSYLAPAMTSAVLTTLMGEWENSQAPVALVRKIERENELKKDPNLKPLIAYILGESK